MQFCEGQKQCVDSAGVVLTGGSSSLVKDTHHISYTIVPRGVADHVSLMRIPPP